MLQDTVVAIALESGVHIQKKVSHLFPCHTQRWMDIVITRDDFWTLTDIVIANLTHTNLVQHALTMTTQASIVATQNKAQSHIEQMSRDDFIPLALKTYSCLHPCFDSLLTSCVHTNIVRHQQTSLVPSMLIFYYGQQMSIALQRAQAIAILQWAAHLLIIHFFHTY